jgi:hypothetical protein
MRFLINPTAAVILFLALPSLAQERDLSTLTQKEWREDIVYFSEQLPKRHKNAFHTLSEHQYNEMIKALTASLPELKAYEIVTRLLQITASVGDGHTAVHIPSSFKRYPINMFWYGTDLYVRSTTDDYKQIVGTRVAKINEMGTSDVNDRLRSIMSKAENRWFDMNVGPAMIMRPEILAGLGIASTADRCNFTFKDDAGKETTLELIPVPLNSKTTTVRAVRGDEPLYRQRMNEKFWFSYIPEINGVYVNFKSYDDLRSNSNSLIDFVEKHKATRLIIDLRQNGGGDFFKGRNLLIDRIKSNALINRKGNLYVIQGRSTFSAAMVNAIDFKKETAAIMVGEPIGERPNSYSENDEMKLPNSGLIISYSTRYYKFLSEDVDAFEPDIRIDPDWASFVAGRDTAMEWIMENCKK